MSATLCLNMIVRNESAILARCLEAVRPWIDAYVVCDTGSTDGTVEVLREILSDIPGEVHKLPFQSFSQARNGALAKAQESLLPFSHVLLVDADMELVVEDQAFREKIVRPTYEMIQKAGIEYDNLRIVGKRTPARYIKRTHEYVETFPPVRLEGAYFIDHGDGSNRKDKYERDLKLLMEDLLESPDDPRTMFYLAETLRYMGRAAESRQWYLKRAASKTGWEEEAWYAAYRAAEMAKDLGDERSFVYESLEAFGRRPERAEPLRGLARFYRDRGKNELASMVALHAMPMSVPKEDKLFVEVAIYPHAFENEFLITGFYSKIPARRSMAEETCMSLAVDGTAHWDYRHTARFNSVHYARSAKEKFGFESKAIEVPLPQGEYVSALNPSIAWDPDGNRLVGIVRIVNYVISPEGRYVMSDGGPVVRTKNLFAILSESFDPDVWKAKRFEERYPLSPDMLLDKPKTILLEDEAVDRRKCGARIVGYEDLRLFRWRDEWWATCTVRDRRENEDAEIALLCLGTTEDLDLGRVVNRVKECHPQRHSSVASNWIEENCNKELWYVCPKCDARLLVSELEAKLAGHNEACSWRPRHEKNWSPISQPGDHLFLVYEHDPFKLLRVNPKIMQAQLSSEEEVDLALDHFRGGTQVVPYQSRDRGGRLNVFHLTMVHEASDHNGRRRYLHRWVRTDGDLKQRRVSDPFVLHKPGIEFASGLVVIGDWVYVSFGVDDREARIGFCRLQDVHDLIEREGRNV